MGISIGTFNFLNIQSTISESPVINHNHQESNHHINNTYNVEVTQNERQDNFILNSAVLWNWITGANQSPQSVANPSTGQSSSLGDSENQPRIRTERSRSRESIYNERSYTVINQLQLQHHHQDRRERDEQENRFRFSNNNHLNDRSAHQQRGSAMAPERSQDQIPSRNFNQNSSLVRMNENRDYQNSAQIYLDSIRDGTNRRLNNATTSEQQNQAQRFDGGNNPNINDCANSPNFDSQPVIGTGSSGSIYQNGQATYSQGFIPQQQDAEILSSQIIYAQYYQAHQS